MESRKYGLATATAMIIGIVIGSGIFFKSDNILIATGGSVPLGVLLFTLAALGIIFGSLTIAQLAGATDDSGGIIAYFEYSYGSRAACAFGWFQTFIYYPALTAVIAWVLGVYICDFWNLGDTLARECVVGFLLVLFLFILNLTAAKAGGLLQNAAAVIKLLPLLFIAFSGLFFGESDTLSTIANAPPSSGSWLAAVGPVAFSFDGWIIATAISHEIKNARRNLPLALTIAPLMILLVYIAYFVGISALLGPDTIMALGDEHVSLAAQYVFGALGGRLMMIFVIISVLGTLNGIIIGSIRLPHALAERDMLPYSRCFLRLNAALAMPVRSALLAFALAGIWLALHYVIQAYALLPNSDVSETFIIISYALYIALYVHVLHLWRKKQIKSAFLGLCSPILAIIGSLFILYCGTMTPYFIYGIGFTLIIMSAACLYYGRR